MSGTSPTLETVADCDHELVELRKALAAVSRLSRDEVMEKINRVLEVRYVLSGSATEGMDEPVLDSSAPET